MRNKRRRTKTRDFNPNQAYIDKAVKLYLECGGTISKAPPIETCYSEFIKTSDQDAVTEFLNDE